MLSYARSLLLPQLSLFGGTSQELRERGWQKYIKKKKLTFENQGKLRFTHEITHQGRAKLLRKSKALTSTLTRGSSTAWKLRENGLRPSFVCTTPPTWPTLISSSRGAASKESLFLVLPVLLHYQQHHQGEHDENQLKTRNSSFSARCVSSLH